MITFMSVADVRIVRNHLEQLISPYLIQADLCPLQLINSLLTRLEGGAVMKGVIWALRFRLTYSFRNDWQFKSGQFLTIGLHIKRHNALKISFFGWFEHWGIVFAGAFFVPIEVTEVVNLPSAVSPGGGWRDQCLIDLAPLSSEVVKRSPGVWSQQNRSLTNKNSPSSNGRRKFKTFIS